jgi:CBS domain-containing protein
MTFLLLLFLLPKPDVDAIKIMQLKRTRRLPVIEQEGKLVGIINAWDTFKIIIKNQDSISTFIGSDLIPHPD